MVPLVKSEPSAFEILLLDARLGPITHTGREDRVQARPLGIVERHRIVVAARGLKLALDDVRSDICARHFARKRVTRIELIARRGRILPSASAVATTAARMTAENA